MIVEQRTYTLKPGGIATYLDLYEHEGRAIQEPVLGHLVGWYYSDFGPQNQIVHIWAYDSYAERDRRRKALAVAPGWKEFLAKIRPLVVRQENRTMLVAPWSPERRGKN